jgi:hypothetical protein
MCLARRLRKSSTVRIDRLPAAVSSRIAAVYANASPKGKNLDRRKRRTSRPWAGRDAVRTDSSLPLTRPSAFAEASAIAHFFRFFRNFFLQTAFGLDVDMRHAPPIVGTVRTVLPDMQLVRHAFAVQNPAEIFVVLAERIGLTYGQHDIHIP